VLPGNHDFYEEGKEKLWPVFTEYMKEGLLLLLDECRRYECQAGEEVVSFFAAPCFTKHSDTNQITWVIDRTKNPAHYNIGIAHGSIKGISLDLAQKDLYFPMTMEELKATGVDFWLLGHTHVPYPARAQKENPVFFFSGTPTPDGFDRKHEGYSWYLEIDEKKQISMQQSRTGGFTFHEIEKVISNENDIKDLLTIPGNNEQLYSLVKLKLRGRLTEEQMTDLLQTLGQLKQQLMWLMYDVSEVKLHISAQHINQHFSEGSFPHRLLSRLAVEDEDKQSLQLADSLLEELKQ